jgi:CheY-like chemotaxis protein
VVSDTGKGISPEELPRIFDRFYQVDRSLTRRHGGLGLGLAIVGHLVEMHGGGVRAESAGLGHGARFTVRLPGAGDPEWRRGAGEIARASAGEERPLRDVRVLFVDDSDDARALVGAVLTSAGADVSLADSAAEALAVVDVKPVDVVLSDIGMPDADGFDFLMQLRERERERRRTPVPVIAVTAYADADTCTRTLAAGFQRHLAKPIDPIELVRAVCDAAAGIITPPT